MVSDERYATILAVFAAREKKVGGEIDYYGVMLATPGETTESLRRQFRRLSLMLHPDKNSHEDAAEAFVLVSEAWGVLQNSITRRLYDTKISLKKEDTKAHKSPVAKRDDAQDFRRQPAPRCSQPTPKASQHVAKSDNFRVPPASPPSRNGVQHTNLWYGQKTRPKKADGKPIIPGFSNWKWASPSGSSERNTSKDVEAKHVPGLAPTKDIKNATKEFEDPDERFRRIYRGFGTFSTSSFYGMPPNAGYRKMVESTVECRRR